MQFVFHIGAHGTDAERLLNTIPNISFNYFTSKDVVRHPLVAAIIEAYEADSGREKA